MVKIVNVIFERRNALPKTTEAYHTDSKFLTTGSDALALALAVRDRFSKGQLNKGREYHRSSCAGSLFSRGAGKYNEFVPILVIFPPFFICSKISQTL